MIFHIFVGQPGILKNIEKLNLSENGYNLQQVLLKSLKLGF